MQQEGPVDLSVAIQGAGKTADVKFYDNVVFQCEEDDVKAFIDKMGFELKEICMGDYLPEHLGALESMPDKEAKVRDVFKEMNFWELTVKAQEDRKDNDEVESDANLPFAVNSEYADGKFKVSIQGRMDTMTAPELLKRFQDIKKEDVRDIEIDVSKMIYVSSAGLRVLLMMCKSLQDKRRFRIKNMTDEVKEILEVTGFDQILLQQ